MVLYINNEHCSSVDQLKRYFTEDLTPDSEIYADLQDYGRHGDIAVWLREMDEPELANKVESISSDLSDSEFFKELGGIFHGNANSCLIQRLRFDQCYILHDICHTFNNGILNVKFSLESICSVNENYSITLTCGWKEKIITVNPHTFQNREIREYEFILLESRDKQINSAKIIVEGTIIWSKIFQGNMTSPPQISSEGTICKGLTSLRSTFEQDADKYHSTPNACSHYNSSVNTRSIRCTSETKNDPVTFTKPSNETRRKNNSLLGKVVNYYSQQKVAEVLLENAGVHVGDIIYIKGHTTEKIIVELREIRTASGSPKSAKQGRVVTFKVSKPVRKKDKVYLK